MHMYEGATGGSYTSHSHIILQFRSYDAQFLQFQLQIDMRLFPDQAVPCIQNKMADVFSGFRTSRSPSFVFMKTFSFFFFFF